MTWRERLDLLLAALGNCGSLTGIIEQIHKTAKVVVSGLEDELHFAKLEKAAFQKQENALRARISDLESLDPHEGRTGIVQIVQHNDHVGELTVLCSKPDGSLEELHFTTSFPRVCPIPPGFRVLQIGAISPNIPFENPSSMGTLLANALRRFNDNVLRNPTFRGIVRDEGMHPDGKEGGTSTLLLELGQYKYDIVISERKGEVPIGAISDPKIEDPRAN